MKITSAVFAMSAPDLKSCPKTTLPEFAFIGRSNVGKSSLINLLTARRDLAKVSDTPGKTKLINFFVINDSWSLVDLPGYGYAKVGAREQADFNKAVSDYLVGRKNIFAIFVLIDSRHPPQRIDLQFLDWLVENAVPFMLVFTKMDKQSASQGATLLAAYKETLLQRWTTLPEIFTSSATAPSGKNEILAGVDRLLTTRQRAPLVSLRPVTAS